jgi:hypothetical protein
MLKLKCISFLWDELDSSEWCLKTIHVGILTGQDCHQKNAIDNKHYAL